VLVGLPGNCPALFDIRRGFAPGFVNYKKGGLDSQPQVIKFTSCLPMVGGSLRVLWLLPPLKLVVMITKSKNIKALETDTCRKASCQIVWKVQKQALFLSLVSWLILLSFPPQESGTRKPIFWTVTVNAIWRFYIFRLCAYIVRARVAQWVR
jgi:hypothetical protein